MEIKFQNVSYTYNHYNYLKNVSFLIPSNEIMGLISTDSLKIPELILTINKLTNGSIIVDDLIIKRGINIQDINKYRKRIGYINANNKRKFIMNNVHDEINICLKNYDSKCHDYEKKIKDTLIMVGLNEKYLDRNPNELSLSEQNKVLFACALCYNPELLIFDFYDKGLTYKEKNYFKKLLRIFKNRYNKTIILVTDDVEFLLDIVDNYVVINNSIVIASGTKKDFYNQNIYQNSDIPKIIDFIKYINSKGHNIEEYIETKELLKGIYRDVS